METNDSIPICDKGLNDSISSNHTSLIFQYYDLNKDGVLDSSEVMKYFDRDKRISKKRIDYDDNILDNSMIYYFTTPGVIP